MKYARYCEQLKPRARHLSSLPPMETNNDDRITYFHEESSRILDSSHHWKLQYVWLDAKFMSAASYCYKLLSWTLKLRIDISSHYIIHMVKCCQLHLLVLEEEMESSLYFLPIGLGSKQRGSCSEITERNKWPSQYINSILHGDCRRDKLDSQEVGLL